MLLTGVFVATAAFVALSLALHWRGRAKIVLALSVAALLAASGCTSDNNTSASAVSSDLSSAGGAVLSTADSAGSAAESAASSAETGMESTSDTAMSSGEVSGTATYAPEQAQLCQARDQFQTSAGQLTDPALLSQGASAIGAAVDKMQNDLDALVTAARPELRPQIDAVQTSLEELRTAVGNLGSGDVAENLRNVTSAAAKVGSSSTQLLSELNTICGE